MKNATLTAPVRHGDLAVHPIAKAATKGLKLVKGNALATGSATGHSHRFLPAAGAKLYDCTDGTMLLRVLQLVRLVHEEHADIKLPTGDYRVSHKRAYDREHGWQNVVD